MTSKSKLDSGHPIGYCIQRETHDKLSSSWKPVIDRTILKSTNFYRKNLFAHYGCVNALEFSNDGSYLISGGDDRRVLLWKVGAALKSKKVEPVVMQAEHGSNVFALAIDSHNEKIFSCGNDDQVIVHDVATGVPLDYFVHEQPVYGVSIDPLNDNIFVSACDDGRLLVYDIRDSASSTDPFVLASSTSAFHAVMFHPLSRGILSGNSKEGVALWDIRKPKTPLLRYGGLNADQCCMSARFSGDGSKILALRRRLPPILYSTHDTAHLFQFNHTGYYNSCTMKSCSFAGTNDEYVLSGSDNFDLYMWRIPTPGSDNKAHIILKGHRSIVNQVRYNKAHSVIMSSGVEKLIKVWSPFSMLSGKNAGINSTFNMYEKERRIYSHTEYINLVTQSGQFMSLTFDTTHKTTKEDPRMMAFFDALVLRDLEGWSEDSDENFVENYAVVSQEESSSNDSSEETQSQSLFNTSTETTSTTTEATVSSQNGLATNRNETITQQEGSQTVVNENNGNHSNNNSNNNGLTEDSDSQPESVIIPISSFEDGVPNLVSRLPNQERVVNSQRIQQRQSMNVDQSTSTDDDDDENGEAIKKCIDPPTTNKHNIIKELISKKHDRLHQLAKAHVVLESAIKKPGKKRMGRNYRNHTYSSSDKNEGKENGPIKKKTKRKSNNYYFNNSSSDNDSENCNNKSSQFDQSGSSCTSGSSSSGSGSNINQRHSRRQRKSKTSGSRRKRSSSSTSSNRRLNKRKMFESFKSLRYERKSSSGGTGSSGPFCSYYCQSQGRYTHKRNSSTDDSSSSSTNDTCNKNKKGNSSNNDEPCTSATANYKDSSKKSQKSENTPKLNSNDNNTSSSSSSPSSSSSSSSSTSSSSSSSETDSASKSSKYKRRSKSKTFSSPNEVSKMIQNDSNDNRDENGSTRNKNGSPAAFKRLRLRKLVSEKEQEENNSTVSRDHTSSKTSNNKRTWANRKLSYAGLNSNSSSSNSADEEEEEEKESKFSSKQPKRRLKYLNPNYKNYSSYERHSETPHKSDNTSEIDNEVRTTTTTTSTVPLLIGHENDFETHQNNHNTTNNNTNFNSTSHNAFEQEINNNSDPEMMTTTIPSMTDEENLNVNENSVPYNFNIDDDADGPDFTQLSS